MYVLCWVSLRFRSIESTKVLSLAAVLFSMAWFWLSFTFPLVLTQMKYDYLEIGAIGTLTSFPFILLSFLFIKSKKKHLNMAMRIPFLILAATSIVLILGFGSGWVYIIIVAITGFFQSMWWIAMEIETGLLGEEGLAEKYSAAWGIPTGIFPIFAGYLIQITGFRSVYILVLIVSILGFIIQPQDNRERRVYRNSKLNFTMILPMVFAGMDMGFITFVIVPVIRNLHYSYVLIGFLLSVYWIAFSAGSFLGNIIHVKNQLIFSIVSGLLAATPIVLLAGLNNYILIFILGLGGLGTSLGFSKVLSYISKTESPRIGVFYYESLFSLGYILATISGGYLALTVSFHISLLIFVAPLIFALFAYIKYRSYPELSVPSNPE